jgi:hypothetical protein
MGGWHSRSIRRNRDKPGASLGLRSRSNDEASVRGLHQGQQSVRTASRGRTHDCKRSLCSASKSLLPGGGHPHMKLRMFIAFAGGATLMWPLGLCAQQTKVGGPLPLCTYDSKSFSEGADICVQAGLILTCSVIENRPVWSVVTDKELGKLCMTPFRGELGDMPKVSTRRHVVRRSSGISSVPLNNSSDKCFSFNGKRYCE